MNDVKPQRSGETRDVELEGLPRWVYRLLLGIMLLLAVLSLPQVATQWLVCAWPWIWQPITGPQIASGCLALNEFGDLLAGAFAPLAFGGLIYTVLMQRDELRAQRRELKISQDIATEQRTAMEEQQKALALQASIMERTARLTNEQEARRDLETLTTIVRRASRAAGSNDGGAEALKDHDYMIGYTNLFIEALNYFGSEIHLGNKVDGTSKAKLHSNQYRAPSFDQIQDFAQRIDQICLQQICDLPSRLSMADKALFEQLRLGELALALAQFKAIVDEP